MSRSVGFIGTGLMGRGMARNLIRKGYSVKIWNRTQAKAQEVAELGGVVAKTPADAASGAEVVVMMLADPTAVLEVVEGPNGILTTIPRGAVVIDSSTISPLTTRRVAEALRGRGADLLDAPVFGSKNDSEKGELGFILGGDKAVLEKIQDVLQCMGKIFHVGPSGMGTFAKLVVNHIICVTLEAMNEGMMLATKAGLDPDVMMNIIQSSRARSGIIEMKGPQVLKGDFAPFFALRLMNKDMGLVLDAAHSLNVPMPLAAIVKEIYSTCMAEGWGEEDFCATIKWLEKSTKIEVRSQKKS
jgi:3-hydroxyisobutyrate dehydrogenase/2-hydroxy-3-oxopropionate reductase